MNKSPTEVEMKHEVAAGGRVTPISGLRSFKEASVVVQTLGHAASFATPSAWSGSRLGLGLGSRPLHKSLMAVKVRLGGAAQGRATPISGLRSFTEASVAVQRHRHDASFATARLVGGEVAFRVRVRIGSTA